MPDALPATPTERRAAIIARLTGCVAAQGRLPVAPPPPLVAIWTRPHPSLPRGRVSAG